MTISYQKINLVVLIVLSIANGEAQGSGAPTAEAAAWSPAGEAIKTACPVEYAASEAQKYPLLFGGVEESCSSGCQPRDGSKWWVHRQLCPAIASTSATANCLLLLCTRVHAMTLRNRNNACRRDASNPAWGLCLPQQRRQLVSYIKGQVQQGAVDASILSLHPCQLHELLADGGRTLWLIG